MAPGSMMIENSTHFTFVSVKHGNVLSRLDKEFPTATTSTIRRDTEEWDSRLVPAQGTVPEFGATIISDGQKRLWAIGGLPPNRQGGKKVPIYAFDPAVGSWELLSYGPEQRVNTYLDTRVGAGAAVLRDCERLTDKSGNPTPQRCIVMFGGRRVLGSWAGTHRFNNYKADLRVAWLGMDKDATSSSLATALGPNTNITLNNPSAWQKPPQANAGNNRRPVFRAYFPGVATSDSAGFVVFGGFGDAKQGDANAKPMNDLWHLDSRPRDGLVDLVHKHPDGISIGYASSGVGWGGWVGRTRDGVYQQRFQVGRNKNCYHSNNQNKPWLRYDLRRTEQNIASVKLFLRADCCTQRSEGIAVYVSQTNSASNFNSAANLASGRTTKCGVTLGKYVKLATLDCPTGTNGRYVWVKMTRTNYLQVCEVEIFKQLLWNWASVPRLENAARSGTAFMNLPAYNDANDGTRRPVLRDGRWAIDGLDSVRNEDNVCTENRAGSNPVLTIDLGSERSVESLRVVERVDCGPCGSRMNGMRLYVGNERTAYAKNYRCPKVPYAFTNQVTVPCVAKGRYVQVMLPGNNRILQVCELEVMAEKEGWPAKRYQHSGVTFRGDAIFFGGVGVDGAALSDVTALDTSSFSWLHGTDTLKALGRQPKGRYGAMLAAVGDVGIWMNGGILGDATRSVETWQLTFDPCESYSKLNVKSERSVAGVHFVECDTGATLGVPAKKGGGILRCGLDGQIVGYQPVCVGKLPAVPTTVKATAVSPASGDKEAKIKVTWNRPATYSDITKYRVEAQSPPYTYSFKNKNKDDVLKTWTMQPGAGGTSNEHDIAVDIQGRLSLTTTDSRDCWWFRGSCPVLSHPFPPGISDDRRFGSIVVETKVTMDALGSNKQAGIVTWWGDKNVNNLKNWWGGRNHPAAATSGAKYDDSKATFYGRNLWDVAVLVEQRSENGLDVSVSRSNRQSWGSRWYGAFSTRNHLPVRTVSLRMQLDFKEGEYSFSYKADGDADWVDTGARFRVWDTYWGNKWWWGGTEPDFGLMQKSWYNGGGFTAYFHYFRAQTLVCSQHPGHEREVAPKNAVQSEAVVDGLDFDFSYSFRVASISANGVSAWSAASASARVNKPSTGQATREITPIRAFASGVCYGTKVERLYDNGKDGRAYRQQLVHTCNRNRNKPDWMALDLGKPHVINYVRIWDRTDCCQNRGDYAEVRVGNSLEVNDNRQCQGTGAGWNYKQVSCYMMSGRYVFISAAFWKRNSFLNIAEMEAFGYVDNEAGCPDRTPWKPVGASTTPPTDKLLYAETTTANECKGNMIDSTCSVQCALGYTLMGGQTSAACDSSGGWDAPAPLCQQPCQEIPLPAGTRHCSQSIVDAEFSSSEDLAQFDSLRPKKHPRQLFWAVEDGHLLGAGSGGIKCSEDGMYLLAIVRGVSEVTGSMVLKTSVRTTDSAGVVFRVVDKDNMYRFRLNMFDETYQLERFLAGDGTVLSSGPFPIPLDKTRFQKIEVRMDGRFISVRVDSIIFAKATDNLLPSGRAGVYALTTAQFDRVQISKSCDASGCAKAVRGGRCEISCRPGWNVVGSSSLVCAKKGQNEYSWYVKNMTKTADPKTEFGCRIRPPAVGDYTLSVPENSERNTQVGEPIQGLLEDDLEQLAYSIHAGNDNNTFAIDLCSGQVKVRNPLTLDFETRKRFDIQVKVYVVNYEYAYTISNVIIYVTNVNEPPKLITKSMKFDEHPAVGTDLGQVVAIDPENDKLEFYIEADETGDGVEVVGSTGKLIAGNNSVTGLNYEMRSQYLILMGVREVDTFDRFETSGAIDLVLNDINDAPVFPDSILISIDEKNFSVGRVLEPAVFATDEDMGNFMSNLTFTLDDVSSPEYASVSAASLALGLPQGADDGSGVPTRIYPPRVNRMQATGALLFSIDAETGAVKIDQQPRDGSNSAVTYGKDTGDPFFLRSTLAREAFPLKVTVADKHGGKATATVAAVVGANLDSDPYVETMEGIISTMNTTGGETVSFIGRNFGYGSLVVNASLEKHALDGTVLKRYTSPGCTVPAEADLTSAGFDTTRNRGIVHCTTPEGTGAGMKWILDRSDGVRVRSLLPLEASYGKPMVEAVRNNTGIPTEGGHTVRFFGRNFGPAKEAITITYGGTDGTKYACNDLGKRGVGLNAAYGTHGYFECATVESVGASLSWVVTVGGQTVKNSAEDAAEGRSVTDSFTHAAAEITSVTVAASGGTTDSLTLDTAGGQELTFMGSNLGPATAVSDGDFTVSFGGDTGEDILFQTCRKPAGKEAHRKFFCTSIAWVGTGHPVSVRVGGIDGGAALQKIDQDETTGSNETGVTIGYLPPQIKMVSGVGARGGKTEGGQVVVITGEHFGPEAAVAEISKVYYGPATDPERHSAVGCRITFAPTPSRMECLTAEGTGRDHEWSVVVGGQRSPRNADPSALSRYGPPVIVQFTDVGAEAALTSGSQTVGITGVNFGPAATVNNGLLSVKYSTKLTEGPADTAEFHPASCTVTISHEQMECTTAEGAGAPLRWEIVVDSLVSTTPTTSYEVPTVTGLGRTEVASKATDGTEVALSGLHPDGNQMVYVSGSGFGPRAFNFSGLVAPMLQAVTYGPAGSAYSLPLGSVTVESHTLLSFKTLPGAGSNLRLYVQVADQVSPLSAATLSYLKPVVHSVTPNTLPSRSSADTETKLTVLCDYLPLRDPLSTVYVVIGNGVAARSLTVLIPPADQAIDQATGKQKLTVIMPKEGLGKDLAVRVGVSRAGKAQAAAASFIALDDDQARTGVDSVSDMPGAGPTSAIISYADPKITYLSAKAADHLPAGGRTAPCPFPPGNQRWDCNDTSVIQVAVIGENFGANPLTLEAADGVTRVVELEADILGTMTWTPEAVFVGSWDHDRIVVFTKMTQGKLRVRLTSTGWDGTVHEQMDQDEYKEMAPQISALEGMPPGGYPTTGGTQATALKMRVSGLDSLSTDFAVEIGGVKSDFFETNPDLTPGAVIDGSAPDIVTQIRNKIVNQAHAQVQTSGLVEWIVFVKVPPGQGSNVDVTVIRNQQISDVKQISYRVPSLSTVQIVSGQGTPAIATAAATASVTAATAGGTIVELRGADLGTCPTIEAADGFRAHCQSAGGSAAQGTLAMACSGTPSAPYDASGAHDCVRFVMPAGEGNGAALSEYQAVGGFRIKAMAGDQTAATAVTMSYMDPVVTRVTGPSFPTRGGVRITVTGTDFGIGRFGFNDTTAGFEVAIGGNGVPKRTCTAPIRVSHTEITCVLPEGGGKGLDVTVSIAGLSRVTPAIIDYDPPVIEAVQTDIPRSWIARLPARVDTASLPGKMVVGGPTAGDFNLTITGRNFGSSTQVTCVRLAWVNRITTGTAVAQETCNGVEDVLGEGEVASARIHVLDHERIVLTVPPGVGRKQVIVDVHGEKPVNPENTELVFDAPYIRPLVASESSGGPGSWNGFAAQGPPVISPATGGTEGGALLTAVGANFGTKPQNASVVGVAYEASVDKDGSVILPNTHYMRVRFHKACVTDAATAGGSRPQSHDLDDCYPLSPEYRTIAVTSHQHNVVAFRSPPGIGVDRNVTIEMVDSVSGEVQASMAALFSYEPPRVVLADPSTVRFEDEAGGNRLVDIKGDNFGNAERMFRDEWTPQERYLAASVGGVACSTTRRRRENGETIVACTLEPVVTVGYKNVSVDIVGQNGFRAKEDKIVTVVCDRDYFGQPEELCLACPTGATCLGYRCSEVECPNGCAPCFDPAVDPKPASCDSCAAECATQTCLGRSTPELPCFARSCTHHQPVPIAGFFNLNSSDRFNADMASECPPNNIIAGRDVCITPCSPKEACIGENLCAVGYRSRPPHFRCSSCEIGYYRRAGLCVKCPDSPELLIILFVVLAIGAAIAAYLLNRMNVDVALVQIGVDYFQVLAIFASARITWPPIIQDIFHIMSAFNLNLEITAPECLIPDIAYVTKWSIMIGIPLGCCVILFIAFLAGYIWRRFVKRQSQKDSMQVKDKIIAGYMVLLYFMYLYITKQILDIFNCVPTDPPDGKLYLQAVFEPCDKPGGVHESLLPFAVIGTGLYIIGFPVFCLYITYLYRELIMLDQLLRCFNVGFDKRKFADKTQEERAWRFRRAYNRLYYAFRPEFYYWILVLLARKFLIAVAALMFADAPDFQMAFVLFILFINYTLQVYFSPYMSRNRFKKVAGDFADRANREMTERAAGSAGIHSDPTKRLTKHIRVYEEFKAIRDKNEKLQKACGLIGSVGSSSVAGAVDVDEDSLIGPLKYNIFNYNTVATLLLAAATLVTLGGIMFESGRLEREGAEASLEAITYVVLTIIMVSLAYFTIVFGVEMAFVCNRTRFERRAKASALEKGAGNRTLEEQARLEKEGVEVKGMQANPMLRASGGSAAADSADAEADRAAVRHKREMDDKLVSALTDEPPTPEVWLELKERFKESLKQVRELTESNQALRREGMAASAGSAAAATRTRTARRSFAKTTVGAAARGGKLLKKPGKRSSKKSLLTGKE